MRKFYEAKIFFDHSTFRLYAQNEENENVFKENLMLIYIVSTQNLETGSLTAVQGKKSPFFPHIFVKYFVVLICKNRPWPLFEPGFFLLGQNSFYVFILIPHFRMGQECFLRRIYNFENHLSPQVAQPTLIPIIA